VVDAVIKSYFDTIPHEKLIDKEAEKVSDESILKLIRSILKAGVMEDGIWEESETGSPQGGLCKA
jgi:retron-type reverse transcriptase